MAKNKPLVPIDTKSEGYVDALYGVDSTDVLQQYTLVQDGVAYDIVIIHASGKADAAALNAAAAYAALPNGSIAYCGTSTLVKAVKAGALGEKGGAWA